MDFSIQLQAGSSEVVALVISSALGQTFLIEGAPQNSLLSAELQHCSLSWGGTGVEDAADCAAQHLACPVPLLGLGRQGTAGCHFLLFQIKNPGAWVCAGKQLGLISHFDPL